MDNEPEDVWAEFDKDCQKVKFDLSNEYCDWWVFESPSKYVKNCPFYKEGKNSCCCQGRFKMEYYPLADTGDWGESCNMYCALKQGGYSLEKYTRDRNTFISVG